MKRPGSARGRRRGACGVAEVGTAIPVERHRRWRRSGPASKGLGRRRPERSTAAVLATTRDQGVQADAASRGRQCAARALQNEGRGVSHRAKSRLPRIIPGGGLGLLSALDRLGSRHHYEVSVTEVQPVHASVAGLVFGAIAVSLNHNRLPVMHQPVDHGGGQSVVFIEDRAPVPERSVGRDDDRAAFVPGGDDLE